MSEPQPKQISLRQYRIAAITGVVVAHLFLAACVAAVAGVMVVITMPSLNRWYVNDGLWSVTWRFALLIAFSWLVCYGVPAAVQRWNPSEGELVVCNHDEDDDEGDDNPTLRPKHA